MGEFSKLANKNVYGCKEVPSLKLTIHTAQEDRHPTKTIYIDTVREFEYKNSSITGESHITFIVPVINYEEYIYLKNVIESKNFSWASLEAEQLFRSAQTGEDEEKTYSTGTWTSIEMMNEYTSSEDVYGTTIMLNR